MHRITDRIKQAWDENPVLVIGVASTAIIAIAKLMDANTERKKAVTWDREVDRRRMMSNR